MSTFGSYGNNNQVSPTLYGLSLFNKNSTVDKTMISFSMWKTTIKVAIFPLIESEDDQIRYDRKNGVAIYLPPMKAAMFASILKDFKDNPTANHSRGVASGQNLITIEDPARSNGFNKPGANPVIVIRKINPDNGTMESSYAYEIRTDNTMVINQYNEKTGAFNKDLTTFKNMELDMIITQLEEYMKAMTNATAFAVTEALYPTLDKIGSKLGIDINSSPYKNTSYFSSNPGTPAENVSQYTGNGLNNMMQSSPKNDGDMPF